jgi:hypothetical protein
LTAGCRISAAFDLDRSDVLAGSPDHVLLAVDKEHRAVSFAANDVAGMNQPPAQASSVASGFLK